MGVEGVGGKDREKEPLDLSSWRRQGGSLATWSLRTAPENVQILNCNWSLCAEIQGAFQDNTELQGTPEVEETGLVK